MLNEGSQALDFTLKDVNGEDITLSSFREKKVVVYFYPKDDTPGCTKEACSFRDWYDDILEKGAVVIGISPDDHASHVKFKEKYNLPFYLLSDPDHLIAEGYGAWGEKNMYGKKSFGIIRSTFLVNEEGTVIKVFKKVNTETHGEDVLKLL
jgi:peroxiredoxin Q/BCP